MSPLLYLNSKRINLWIARLEVIKHCSCTPIMYAFNRPILRALINKRSLNSLFLKTNIKFQTDSLVGQG